MRQELEGSALQDLADRIASLLRNGNLKQAREEIASAMAAFADAPEPHNLLGIYYEQEGDLQSARKHYRAAYALDPSYKPCCRNLERITCFDFSTKITDADFGDGAEQTEDPFKRKIDISR